jgi:predicted nucleotidyltransferase
LGYSWENAPSEVKSFVDLLFVHICKVLKEKLIGFYLHGSLAMGCFSPERSDIDILVVTNKSLTLNQKKQLAELFLSHSNQPFPIEISFVTLAQLSPWQHPTPYEFHYSESWREKLQNDLINNQWREWNSKAQVDADLAAHITILRHAGVRLHGPDIQDVFPDVPARDYESSILSDFADCCNHITDMPIYAVLNSCRVYLYFLEGKISSKEEAGRWAEAMFPQPYHSVVKEALMVYANNKPFMEVSKEKLLQFRDYIREQVSLAVEEKK